MKNQDTNSRYVAAMKRVAAIKRFYKHVVIYVVINTFLLLWRKYFLFGLLSKEVLNNPGFIEWVDWNVYGTPVVWGIFLILHGIIAFNGNLKPGFIDRWEEKQLQKFMNTRNEKE